MLQASWLGNNLPRWLGGKPPHSGMGRGVWSLLRGFQRYMADFLPIHEKQTNNRGELRAALVALQKKTQAKQTLICPDSLLVVDGALSKAQKWKCPAWVGSKGSVGHADHWEQICLSWRWQAMKCIGYKYHHTLESRGITGQTNWRMSGGDVPPCFLG